MEKQTKALQQLNPDFQQLLLYAYGNLPEDQSEEIRKLLQDPSNVVKKQTLKGIYLDASVHNFDTPEQHATWLLEQKQIFFQELEQKQAERSTVKQIPRSPKTRKFPFLRYALIAAVIGFFVFSFFYVSFHPKAQPQPLLVYADYQYAQIHEDRTLRSPSSDANKSPYESALDEVERAFEEERYQAANDQLLAIQTDSLLPHQIALIDYYEGRILLAVNRSREAQMIFQSLTQQAGSPFYQESLYQLGLSYLQAGEMEVIETYFSELSTNQSASGNNRDWAKEVLKALRM